VVQYALQLFFEVIVFQIYFWQYTVTVRIKVPSCQWLDWWKLSFTVLLTVGLLHLNWSC